MNNQPRLMLSMNNVTRTFQQADRSLQVLRGVTLQVAAGELVALIGPSGAGKSTLLHAAGLLEKPTSGSILIDGKEAGTLNEQQRTETRRSAIGFVYQFHHLLPEFSALENIILPQLIGGTKRSDAATRAAHLLQTVGLSARADHRPGRLSGGEQQRVALARALANAPKLLIADEPTGNLDHTTSDEVFEVLKALIHTGQVGALVATHNQELARRMDRVLELRDGVVRAA